MRSSTLWILLTLAVALGAVVWWQLGREQDVLRVSGDRLLLEGVSKQQIQSLRVDNLERSLQVRIERQEDGGWRLRDPIDAPAAGEVLEPLLDQLTQARGVPHKVDDLASVSLAPPRAVLELHVQRPGGKELRRIEVGSFDLDHQSMYLRVDGQVLRAPRAFDSLLDRDLTGWRSTRIAHFSPESVIEVRRSGRFVHPRSGETSDMQLHALLDEGWRSTSPFVARLEPGLVGALLVSLASMQASSFIDDAGADLSHFGLEEPAVELELQTVTGARDIFRLAPANRPETWYCMRAGDPQIYRVEEQALVFVLLPAPRFLDHELVVAPREKIARIRLAADGREVLLERQGFAWMVSATRGGAPEIARTPADTARVEGLLAGLEASKILEFLPDVEMPASLVEQSFRVETADRSFGGTLGPEHRARDGAEGLLFQREGDQLVGFVDPDLLALVRTDPAGLRSLQLHKLAEIDIVRIRVSMPGQERQYARNDRGRWSREGTQAEARDFAVLVDRLLSVRAAALLPGVDPSELGERILVVLEARSGEAHGFVLGRRPGGDGETETVYSSTSRAGTVAGGLHQDLLKLLAAE